MKVLALIRRGKKKSCAEVAKIYGKNESSNSEIVKKEKKFMLVLLSHLRLQKSRPWFRDKCLVKMEKVLNLDNKVF